jgi:tetratricopeptide (TPR) repeat protein
MVSRDGQVRVMDFGLARQAEKPVATNGGKMVAVAVGEGGVVTTQRLPAPLAEPGAPIAPLDGSTLVLTPVSGDHRPHEFEPSTTAMFDQRLTRTGAMMGTPAYMAPEQFRGRATDARSDQFAFCVALYEALYGERPFGGNTLMALTNNVVNGRIREIPANVNVPPWVRKILLRGLRVNADERFPAMDDLLEALGKNPAVARRRLLVATSAMLLAVGLGFGMRQGMADPKPACGGGPEKLAGIWELVGAGQGETPRQAQLHTAFLKTGKSYAKDVWATTSRALSNYASAWTAMYKETCQSAVVNKVQSTEVMDLRMDCLNERLGGLHALTEVFADADGEVVENAVSASNALASLDRCANVPVLRAVVKPPENAETKAKVDDLRKRLAGVKAKFDAGQWKEALKAAPAIVADARSIDYQPLVAETLVLTGMMYAKSNDVEEAERALNEAFLVADASRHDEVRAETATHMIFLLGYQKGQFAEAHRWAKQANAVLKRLGGHDLLQAWLKNDLACVYALEGDEEAGVEAAKEGLAIKERVLGRDHPDVGISEGNVGLVLQGMGSNDEALAHFDRAIHILENGLGSGHPELALQLSNRGEVLSAIGHFKEAHQSFDRALLIWEKELGSDNLDLAYGLTGLGVTYLAEGEPAKAIAPLERAFLIRSVQETEPSRRADTTFALARALWAAHRDRERAGELARQARADYVKAVAKKKLAQIDQWIASRA